MSRQQAFSYNGATITVRETHGIDRIDRQLVFQKLTYNRADEREVNRAIRFAEFVLRSQVEGTLDYPWATLNSDNADLQAAFEEWKAWPKALMDEWLNVLYTTDEAPGDEATQPDTDPND